MASVFYYTLLVLFMIVCLFMILLVLIQKGRGGGIASAFGGAGGNTAFGSKTGDVLTWATSIVFGIFLLLAIILNLLANSMHAATVAGAAKQVSKPTPVSPVSGSEQMALMPEVPASTQPAGATPVTPTVAVQPAPKAPVALATTRPATKTPVAPASTQPAPK